MSVFWQQVRTGLQSSRAGPLHLRGSAKCCAFGDTREPAPSTKSTASSPSRLTAAKSQLQGVGLVLGGARRASRGLHRGLARRAHTLSITRQASGLTEQAVERGQWNRDALHHLPRSPAARSSRGVQQHPCELRCLQTAKQGLATAVAVRCVGALRHRLFVGKRSRFGPDCGRALPVPDGRVPRTRCPASVVAQVEACSGDACMLGGACTRGVPRAFCACTADHRELRAAPTKGVAPRLRRPVKGRFPGPARRPGPCRREVGVSRPTGGQCSRLESLGTGRNRQG